MKSSKTMILVVVAIGCGLVAAYLTARLTAHPSTNTELVWVATQKIPQGTMLKEPDKLFAQQEMIAAFLEVNQLIDVVFRSESIDQLVLVLVNPAGEIVGNADVHDRVVPVGQQVYVIVFVVRHYVLALLPSKKDFSLRSK